VEGGRRSERARASEVSLQTGCVNELARLPRSRTKGYAQRGYFGEQVWKDIEPQQRTPTEKASTPKTE